MMVRFGPCPEATTSFARLVPPTTTRYPSSTSRSSTRLDASEWPASLHAGAGNVSAETS
jgi:hypothetical protein